MQCGQNISFQHVRAHAFLKHEDQLRLYRSQKWVSEVQKRRKYKAREKVAAEETPTYGPGEF